MIEYIKSVFKKLDSALPGPISPYTLAAFRIVFGALMVWETTHYWKRIYYFWTFPKTFFPFEVFSFLPVLKGSDMQLAHIVMGIGAALICIGLFFRFGCFLFFLIYSYIFVIEKSYYNNHYYLIILLALLLGLTNADSVWSLKNLLSKKKKRNLVPYWQILILQLQMVIVYVGGAIAKVNWDWLRGEPMGRFLSHNYDMPYIGEYFHLKPVIFFFAYSGMIFDLLVGPALLWKRTRVPALIALVFFHFMNNNLFSIGVFPYLGIGSAVIFLEPRTPKKILDWLLALFKFNLQENNTGENLSTFSYGFIRPILIVYFLIQILLPFRHWFFQGNVSWTEEGHNFAWHMKLRAKHASAYFRVIDGATGRESRVDMYNHLNPKQSRKITTRPYMQRQFALYLAEQYKKIGWRDPKIYVINPASLNGRPYQFLVKPQVDLLSVKESLFTSSDWIEPLKANQEIGNYSRPGEKEVLFNHALKLPLEGLGLTPFPASIRR